MNQGEVKRGKHAKIRKMKEKYADQDEEDRQMRMALTGSKQVQGFDLAKHQEFKHGALMTQGSKKLAEEGQEAVAEAMAEDQEAAEAEALAEEGAAANNAQDEESKDGEDLKPTDELALEGDA